jgi:pimeloyl-ACP methyl ester carboxylesterase
MKIQAREFLFSVAITATGRLLLWRDRLLGRLNRRGDDNSPDSAISRLSIESGNHLLDAVLVEPRPHSAQAGLLICHGIGETVEHYRRVQQILAANGVASLVFDYSGYGRSSGFFQSRQSEQDAVAAFRFLQSKMGDLPVSLLGFSLGSGIAAAVAEQLPVHCLVLCAAFTSLRKACRSVGIPSALSFLVPPIWDAEEALRGSVLPTLVVHGENDRLFPLRMAKELAGLCGAQAKLVRVAKLKHNQPFRRPEPSYWGEIIARFLLQSERGTL